MKIVLEELQHQSDALKSIIDSFPGLEDKYKYKKDSKENYLIKNAYQENINIDIKMETGTGKTYVYTRLMYELHQLYGLNKFVIIVPSPAIKLGTKNFIESEYARREFSKFYGNTDVELSVINSGDFKSKSGRKNFPAHLTNFIEGSSYNNHVIHVMIINADMLRSASMTKSDYDQTLFGGLTCPLEALKKVKPIVIVDEPHRFSRENSNYKAIESIKPQIIFRFGATFPDIKVGKGKSAYMKKDYYRGIPQYNLNAVDSFNNGLVKGIDIYYPKLSELDTNNIYTVDSVKAKELTLKKDNKKWTLNVGDLLSSVDSGFEGDIEYSGSKELSNELVLDIGMKLIPGTFKTTYQELVISDAIDKHFEIEISNFMRDNNKEINKPKIKTLSLFFIDNIKSYRDDHGWLKDTFERLLKDKLNKLIREYEYKSFIREKEYLDFLRATLKDLIGEKQVVHAGYFGEDRGSGDDDIQKEIDDILRNKEKLLSFKDDKGNWITRRFLFSKWTLREGWDNPNVFVIAKLRTSGSENSKIQEVGRGLRLPVDEMGHRVQFDDKESRLAFLIGYDEKEFAKKLIGEINSDTKINLDNTKITDDMIKVIVDKRQSIDKEFTDEVLLDNLDNLNIINRKNEFKESVEINGIIKSGFEWLCEYYPEINEVQLRLDRIKEPNNKKIPTAVKLNKENWNKVKNIWKQFSNRYMIEFNRIPNNIELLVNEVFNKRDLFVREKPIRQHETFVSNDNEVKHIIREEESIYSDYKEGLPYGYFVKILHEKTRVSITQLHKCLVSALKNDLRGDSTYLSETSLKNLVTEFNKRFDETFSQVYKYTPLNFSASTSIYNSTNEDFIDEIRTGLVGANFSELVVKDDRYLYDRPPLFYDSVDPEKSLLEYNYADYVTVFGKLPKNAIKVPKYTGGFTTPDLIYVVEKNDGDTVYLLVETKADNMRVGDQEILKIQKEFFRMLEEYNIEYSEAIKPNDVYTKLKEINERE